MPGSAAAVRPAVVDEGIAPWSRAQWNPAARASLQTARGNANLHVRGDSMRIAAIDSSTHSIHLTQRMRSAHRTEPVR
jgi:hypothetical protein